MAWSSFGDPICDTCEEVRMGDPDRQRAIQMLIASTWHYATGVTMGGTSFEVIACSNCGHEERKRPKSSAPLAQNEMLPIDWTESEKKFHESGPGGYSR